jgi:hypothetical protein
MNMLKAMPKRRRCRHIDKLPTCISGVALLRTDAVDAVADPIELAELFDVDVDQFSGMLSFIAADRLGRLQRGESVKAEPTQDAADGCR